MSAQNNLKKPTFTKSVMGYSAAEVDRYIDHINERYNTVSREATELKRRVIALQVRLDEAESKLAEAEKNAVTKKVLDRDAIMEVFAVLDRENTRHGEFIDIMKDKLSSMLAEETVTCDDPDEGWQEVLDDFIAVPAEAAKSAAPEDPREIPYRAVFASMDDTDASSERVYESTSESTAHLRGAEDISDRTDEVCEDEFAEEACEDEFAKASAEIPTKAPTESEATASEPAAMEPEDVQLDCDAASERTSKSPAETLAELDFYQDDVHRDGESFDPMTLAAQATARKNRPTLGDFFRSQDGDKK